MNLCCIPFLTLQACLPKLPHRLEFDSKQDEGHDKQDVGRVPRLQGLHEHDGVDLERLRVEHAAAV